MFRHVPGWLSWAFLLCVASMSYAAEPLDSPHIVVVLCDDLGYGDVQPLNPASRIATPHFNRLASEGMVFSDAHTPSAVCTPTRYGILCGRYCWRTRLKQGVLGGYSSPLIDGPTIATRLNSAGYETVGIGKWHLGLGWPWRTTVPGAIDRFDAEGKMGGWDDQQPLTDSPVDHGFDKSYILPASLDMSPYVYIQDRAVVTPVSRKIEGSRFPAFYRGGELGEDFSIEGCLDHLTDRAVQVIRGRSDSDPPLFLYLALPSPHKPIVPSGEFSGRSKLGPYGDYVMQVDDAVGRISAALDQAKMASQTLLIVTSDNGSYMRSLTDPGAKDHLDDPTIQAYRTDRHRPNGPWRGTKADIWEGGHRVPLLVRWPEQIPAGTRCDQPVGLVDLAATLAELAGVGLGDDAFEDSHSFASCLRDPTVDLDRPPLILHSVGGMFAVRDGKWKLVLGNGSGGRETPRGKPFAEPYFLCNLADDPGETTNLAEQYPGIVRRLTVAYERQAEGGDRVSDRSDSPLWCQYAPPAGRARGKTVVLVAGDDEYRSEETMPMLGKILARRHGFQTFVLFPINPESGEIQPDYQTNIPGMQLLDGADLVILGLRFRHLPDEQMKHFVDYLDSGRPMIGLRTSTHAFRYPGDSQSPFRRFSFNSRDWPGGFGRQVLGDTWINHHGHHGKQSTRGVISPAHREDPILRGVSDVWGPTDVYGIRNLPSTATVLLRGAVLSGMNPGDSPVEGPQNDPMMPIAWTKTFESKSGKSSRIFCTTMGASVDFECEDLRRLIVNAAFWCLELEDQIPDRANVDFVDPYRPTPFGFGNYQRGLRPADFALRDESK